MSKAAQEMEVVDTISEAMAEAESNDIEDWDDLDASQGADDEDFETNSEKSDTESKDSDSGDDSSKDEPESKQDDIKDESPESKDSSGEEKSDPKSEEGLIEVKVDGELQKVSIDELKNNYAGKVAWDKKFTEIDRERKEVMYERDSLQNDINDVNKYVAELGQKMQSVGMIEGLYEIGALNNIGPHQIKKALIAELLPEINKLSDMPEDRIELEYQRQELEYQKQLIQQESQRFQSQQAQRELQQKTENLMNQTGVSVDEYKEAESFLSARKGELGEEITPELITDYAVFAKAESRAGDLITNFQGGKHAESKEVVDGVIDILLQYPEFSDEDVLEVMQDALTDAQQDVAKKEVEKVTNNGKASTPKKQTQKEEIEELEDWDDL